MTANRSPAGCSLAVATADCALESGPLHAGFLDNSSTQPCRRKLCWHRSIFIIISSQRILIRILIELKKGQSVARDKIGSDKLDDDPAKTAENWGNPDHGASSTDQPRWCTPLLSALQSWGRRMTSLKSDWDISQVISSQTSQAYLWINSVITNVASLSGSRFPPETNLWASL